VRGASRHTVAVGSTENGARTIAPAPTREEAAAIIAAVERFMRATAPRAAPEPDAQDEWSRAAILEGVERGAPPDLSEPWMSG
jgi:hypothetical protein